MRRALPDAEFRLWCELRASRLGGLRFRRQQPIGRFIVDFYCAEKRWSSQWTASNMHWPSIQRPTWSGPWRWRRLAASVIRHWTHEVEQDLDSVCQAILAAARGEWRNG